MAGTRTFSIIKPDATRRNLTGAVIKMLEDGGLRVVASKRIQMSKAQAEGFYAVHSERPFFNDLVTAPVRLRRVASGLMIENVRVPAMRELQGLSC